MNRNIPSGVAFLVVIAVASLVGVFVLRYANTQTNIDSVTFNIPESIVVAESKLLDTSDWVEFQENDSIYHPGIRFKYPAFWRVENYEGIRLFEGDSIRLSFLYLPPARGESQFCQDARVMQSERCESIIIAEGKEMIDWEGVIPWKSKDKRANVLIYYDSLLLQISYFDNPLDKLLFRTILSTFKNGSDIEFAKVSQVEKVVLESLSKIDIAGWPKLESKEFGFSVAYPPGGTVNRSQGEKPVMVDGAIMLDGWDSVGRGSFQIVVLDSWEGVYKWKPKERWTSFELPSGVQAMHSAEQSKGTDNAGFYIIEPNFDESSMDIYMERQEVAIERNGNVIWLLSAGTLHRKEFKAFYQSFEFIN